LNDIDIISEKETIENVKAQLFENKSGQRCVRIFDADTNENFKLIKFPNRRLASLYFLKL
jgi:hypothetical protein